jgi:chromosome segregation ATPase
MADPTLKDVLHAIDALTSRTKADFARVEGRLARVDDKLARVEENLEDVQERLGSVEVDQAAHRGETAAHRGETAAHRLETKKGFADIDDELTRHAAVHREIEKDITTLKRRPPRTAARPSRRR